MVESVSGEEGSWLDFFDYRSSRIEPRLFQVSYSRELHEQIENQMRGKLTSGQPVLGKLSKLKGNERKGEGKQKGDGSESQNQEWQFHPLRPSDFLNKPEN